MKTKAENNLDIYVLPLISCALNMRISILYEFDGFLSWSKRARNKGIKTCISDLIHKLEQTTLAYYISRLKHWTH